MAKNSSKVTLVDTIYDNIKRDITQRLLLPGDKINIKDLSQRYGASETPIKLALNRLISERIIENFPRQGMRIRPVSAEELDEVFDLRLMLDLYYTSEIITTVNYNEILRDELKRNVEEHLKIVTDICPESPVDTFIKNYQYDHDFHELYLKCSGSKKIVEVFNYLNPFLYSNYIFKRQSKEKDISGVKEHQQILDAILSENDDELKKILIVHNKNAKRAIGLILKVDKIL